MSLSKLRLPCRQRIIVQDSEYLFTHGPGLCEIRCDVLPSQGSERVLVQSSEGRSQLSREKLDRRTSRWRMRLRLQV